MDRNATRVLLREMVVNGGPDPDDYAVLHQLLAFAPDNDFDDENDRKEWAQMIQDELGQALSEKTMQGFAYCKPHGYAGDFEMIDRIHTQWHSPVPSLKKWDRFFHAQAAPRAVRNRKAYFYNLLKSLDSTNREEHDRVQVLNVGSGPCRDVFEYFSRNQLSKIHVDCVDMDMQAIEYARSLCTDCADHLTFHHKNVFRFTTEKKYELVWSAGLFDYLDDKAFVFLLRKLSSLAAGGGEIIIGNFSTDNPTRVYMEVVGQWFLHHRSADELRALALDAGFSPHDLEINAESEGVNLFLHIRM